MEKLRDSLSPNAKVKMSQVFLEFREPFLLYGEYCSCLLGAIDVLADVCKKNQIIEQLVQVSLKVPIGLDSVVVINIIYLIFLAMRA